MLSVVRTGPMSLSATSPFQINLTCAEAAKSITLRVTDNIRNKHKKLTKNTL